MRTNIFCCFHWYGWFNHRKHFNESFSFVQPFFVACCCCFWQQKRRQFRSMTLDLLCIKQKLLLLLLEETDKKFIFHDSCSFSTSKNRLLLLIRHGIDSFEFLFMKRNNQHFGKASHERSCQKSGNALRTWYLYFYWSTSTKSILQAIGFFRSFFVFT